MQGAAPGDVEHLGAAADAEDGQATGVGLPAEGELEGVDLAVGGTELGVGVGAVGDGIEVGAAREQQAREVIEQGVDAVGRERGERHR